MQAEALPGVAVEAQVGVADSVVGTFQKVVDAERALGALRELGVPSDRVSMVMGESREQESASSSTATGRGTNVGGGAATGATLGGIVGILWGWISGSVVADVPGAVATVSSGILTSAIAGLAIGAAVGGLIGALVGVGMPEVEASEDEGSGRPERRIVVTVQATGSEAEQAHRTLEAHGALDVNIYRGAIQHDKPALRERVPAQVAAPMPESEAEPEIANLQEEVATMSDQNSGHDPNSLTGTQDAIDPETGTLGTAGTPVTAGYGVSGSTVGTGTSAGRTEQESGDFSGSMPDTSAYDGGGRGSGDLPERVMEHDTPVEEKHGDVQANEGAVPSEPETRDVYEGGSGYSAPTSTIAADTDATDYYAPTDVEAPPTYANVEMESTQESAGTNIPGTSDPRGLGDNTDDRR